MKFFYYSVLFLALLISTFTISNSQDSDKIITVRKALDIARNNNPALKAMEAELQALKSAVPAIYSPEKPVFNYAVEGMKGDFYGEKRLSIMQGFDFPLKTIYQSEAAGITVESLEYEIQSKTMEIRSEVKKAYARLAYFQQVYRIRQMQSELADSLRQAVEFRFEAGFATELDRLKSDINYEEAQNELNDMRVMLHVSRYDMFTLLGLDPEKQSYSIEFTDSLVYLDVEIVQKSVLSLLEDYPGVTGSRVKSDLYRNLAKAAWADMFPDISLAYHRHDYGDGYDFNGFEIGFSLPVWFFMDQSSRIQENRAMEENSTWLYREKLLDYKKNIEYAWHGYDESRKKIKRFNENIRNKSYKLRELTFLAYREGQIGLLDMLDAERIYLDNELKFYDELLNYYLNILDLEKFTNENYLF